MPRAICIIKIDPERQHVTRMSVEGGNNMVRPVQRILRAKQLGWRELCKIDEQRLMGRRAVEGAYNEFENYDAGPTPLIVAADAEQEANVPGWRLRGGEATVGASILFGQGIGGGMVNCPVSEEWVHRQIIWMTAAEIADADEAASGSEE